MTLFFVALAIAFVWFLVHQAGNPKFWALVRKNPDVAWIFFNSRPEWFVEHKPAGVEVTGPFKVLDVTTGKHVNVYCRASEIAASQSAFIKVVE